MRFTSTVAAAALATGAAADSNYLGFNSGSTFGDGSAKQAKDFEAEFTAAQGLKGAPGDFNSFRLYTNIQAGTKEDPIQAFQAAIDTKTNLLLGVWASGTDSIASELAALQAGIKQYGDELGKLVIGISIGSEDLYRNSVTGVTNKAGVGNSPDNIVDFINDYKKAVKGTSLENVPVGHVDTWDAWTNSSNKAVLEAVDWLGVDEYPYYETGKGNDIGNAKNLFDSAFDAVKGISGGKPVWVTETGWPVSGETWDEAVPSIKNAKTYWDAVGCGELFGKVPTFWYNLQDTNSDNKQLFAITDNLSTTPKFNLTCPAKSESSSSASASATGTSATTLSKASASSKPSSGSSSVSGSGSTQSSGSGSGSAAQTGSGSDSGSSKGSTPASTASPSATAHHSGASSYQAFSLATYGGLALVAGVFAFF